MSLPSTCCTSTCTPEPVLVPGVQGEDGTPGTDGSDGVNAFTLLTANLTLPAIGGSVSASVANNSWASVGQVVFGSDGVDFGTFEVASKTGTTIMGLTFLGVAGDASPGAVIGSGGQISPGGHPSALSAALPTALTDNSTGTASNTIAAGVGIVDWFFTHTFIAGTAAVEPVTTWTPGFKFKILGWHAVTSVLLVGAGGSRIANMEINATDVGTIPSTITIPIANAAVGTVTAGTAVAGANTGSASDTFSIEIAAGGTEFSAGVVTFVVRVQNMDQADSVASLAAHVNSLITSLTP